MTGPTGTMSLVAQLVVLCVLAVTLLLEVGCVSRRTYDRVKAESLEQAQALETVRGDVGELDREIVGLQASNRRAEAALSELRTVIQREEEQLPILRERAEEALASLKIEVATLMNQSWHLARKIVDIHQESSSLQTKVAQYKEEMEQAQSSTLMASNGNRSSITQATVIEPPPSTVATELSAAPPQQIAQTNPTPPSPPPVKPPAPPPSVKVDPPSTNDSWIETIISWFSKVWNWLFG